MSSSRYNQIVNNMYKLLTHETELNFKKSIYFTNMMNNYIQYLNRNSLEYNRTPLTFNTLNYYMPMRLNRDFDFHIYHDSHIILPPTHMKMYRIWFDLRDYKNVCLILINNTNSETINIYEHPTFDWGLNEYQSRDVNKLLSTNDMVKELIKYDMNEVVKIDMDFHRLN